ncbi:hypothetical protein JAAARDRAFT_135194 [Jaapia argillacea MUCL 33604]|uniref:U3 small nucleolar RNA-associated protein 10 n=1 Tax=Jaapia argillacea MUCL 33604 TaxID=933084 RepID=A0A067PTE1_9AGAM|nr:hypothetical protein JAAARDRAFT_135194 [Jaapia argillacea MUCL 33604]
MVSSLAAQLSQGASLNLQLLVDRSKRKPTESYLFTGREADHHDLESIHALANNGFIQLRSLQPSIAGFENALFSDAAKSIDRTLLDAGAMEELDGNVGGLLRCLGMNLMEAPTGKVLEWLVRRFRINEFNVEDVLTLFLPYHESPHFAKMVTILHIKERSKFHFLIPYKSAATSLPRAALVTEMLRNVDLARFATSLLSHSLKNGHCHRTLVVFHTSVVLDYIVRSKHLDEGTMAFLLPSILEPLQQSASVKSSLQKDVVLGNYVVLSALSQKCTFSPSALNTILYIMTSTAHQVAPKQYLHAAISVCSPQQELEELSGSVIEGVLSLPELNGTLVGLLSFVGAEKLLVPLLVGFLSRLEVESTYQVLESACTSTKLSPAIVRKLTEVVFHQVVSQDTMVASTLQRRLLSVIKLHHADAFQRAAEALMENDEDAKPAVEQLILSLSVKDFVSGAGEYDTVLASTSADANVRNIAVRDLLQRLPSVEAIHSALLARVFDTSIQVLETLYSVPSLLKPIFLEHASTYLKSVASVLVPSTSTTPSRHIIRLHLTFILHHFSSSSTSQAEEETNAGGRREIFETILFPFLLFSKPRQKTASLVWDIIGGGVKGFEIISGCLDVVGKGREGEEGGERSSKDLRKVNLELGVKMAESILASNNFAHHFDFILSKLQDSNPHARNLALLITRALLCLMSGENQIEAAGRVLDCLGVGTLDELGDAEGADGFWQIMDEETLGNAVVMKPSSWNTTHRLRAVIIALMPVMSRPTNLSLDWDSGDTRGVRYVRLMRHVYKLATSSTNASLLSASLLRALFINIGDDTLAFLSGVWLDVKHHQSTNDDGSEVQLQYTALRHAAAFLAAYHAAEKGVDFQTALPAILVCLQNGDQMVREAGVECVLVLLKISQAKKASSVYYFDAIYGGASGQLQYLDWDDVGRYVQALAAHGDHFVSDPAYIRTFHQSHLGRAGSESRKESAYKQRVLCYLLSHIASCPLPTVKLGLMRPLADISHYVKVDILLPIIRGLVDDAESKTIVETFGEDFIEYSGLALSVFDVSAVKALNDEKGTVWPVFLSAVHGCFGSGVLSSSRVTLARSLERGLFAGLTIPRKVEICRLLLELGSKDVTSHSHCKDILLQIVDDPSLVVNLLNTLQPAAIPPADRATKRQRVDDSSISGPSSDPLQALTLLAEVISSRPPPASPELISTLLETLNRVTTTEAPLLADKAYTEQLLMSAIEASSSQVVRLSNLKTNAVRLDVLVELIRAADNPQTFHQALLLMASMARLAPEDVLHHIMPVFTFMGSAVFHRDDAYSFRVTIESIVPVMVSSLRAVHEDPLDLYLASREFLHIFTDAATHVPRHRRPNFFAHLVDTLGPEQYLAPVCMLFVEKGANRIVRQDQEELHNSLSLPLSTLQHCNASTQIHALIEILKEARRLICRAIDPSDIKPTFLESSHNDEHTLPPSTVSKRRAQALLIVVGQALQSFVPRISGLEGTERPIGEVASALLDITTVGSGSTSEKDIQDVIKAARVSLENALTVMPAAEFINSVLGMLQSDDVRTQIGALDLISTRFESVSEATRRTMTSTINDLITRVGAIVSRQDMQTDALRLSGLDALRSICGSSCPGEENALTNTVPIVIQCLRNELSMPKAISVLHLVKSADLHLSGRLGPRIIPQFREIVQSSMQIVNRVLATKTGARGCRMVITLLTHPTLPGTTSQVLSDALAVQVELLKSIPTFWGIVEISQVVNTYLDHYTLRPSADLDGLKAVTKALVKRLPAKTLLPALFDMLPSGDGSLRRLEGFFDLVKRALHIAPQRVVIEHLRSLFKLFLEAFDIRAKVEGFTVPAFLELVVKLNETAFRPLFRKLFDWAFTGQNPSAISRKVTLCAVYEALLDYFKTLMTPYMSFLLAPFTELLGSSDTADVTNEDLWIGVVKTLAKSFMFDEGAFWREDRLRQIAPPLIQQIPVAIQSNITQARTILPGCLSSLTDSVMDDALLKTINLNVLMHTRSEDSRIRLFALTCSETLWSDHGEKLMGFVSETSTFLAECAEDENDTVVRECHKLKAAVEKVTGDIHGL